MTPETLNPRSGNSEGRNKPRASDNSPSTYTRDTAPASPRSRRRSGPHLIPKVARPRVHFTGSRYFLRIGDGEDGPWLGPFSRVELYTAPILARINELDARRYAIARDVLWLARSHAAMVSRPVGRAHPFGD